MSLHIGEDIGDYRVVSIIGAGSMGQVFQVEHRITKRKEALKVLAGDFSTESQVRRFEREIETQARLDHPHIARVHNALHSSGSLMLVMELVTGESLEKKLRNGQVSRAAGIEYVRQTLSALEYAHRQGVVHRDVNPANLIIDRNGTVKLTDFGVAKSLGDYQLTSAGEIVGSLHYMPPEQIRRHTEPDPRSDIYSTGAVLYEILTGRKIYDCPDRLSLMMAQVQQQPRPPLEIDPTIGPELNAVVLRALEKDPALRYQTAEEFLAALQAVSSTPVAKRRFFSKIPVGALALSAFAFTYQGSPDRSVLPPPVAFTAPAVVQASEIVPVTDPSPKMERKVSNKREQAEIAPAPIADPAPVAPPEASAPTLEVTSPEASSPEASSPAPSPQVSSPEASSSQHKRFWSKLNPFRRRRADLNVGKH